MGMIFELALLVLFVIGIFAVSVALIWLAAIFMGAFFFAIICRIVMVGRATIGWIKDEWKRKIKRGHF